MRRMATWIATGGVLGVLASAGCGVDQPPVCDSLSAVRTSVDHLRNTNVSENGLSQLQTDLSQLRADLIQLRTDAQAEFPAEIERARTAVNQFAATVAAARATPDAATLAAVRTAMSSAQDSTRQLADAISGTC